MFFQKIKKQKFIVLVFFYFFFFNFFFNKTLLKNMNIFLLFQKNELNVYKIKNLSYLKKKKKYINFFPKKIQERIFGDLFLRFLESFFGTKVLFFFVRNLWLHFNVFIFCQETIFSKRILQYSRLASRKKRGHW